MLAARVGEVVPAATLDAALAAAAPDRFRPSIRQGIARRAASSWTQSGHLAGRARKVRRHPVATPATAAYALVLGYLGGMRGQPLFITFWARLLDLPPPRLGELAVEASRAGWINYRQAGGVTEVRFPELLTTAEQEALCGAP